MNIVALIPARAGSKRVPNKNTRLLNGHPLIAYAVVAAQQSEVFTDVCVSTNSPLAAEVAKRYDATIINREPTMATDDAPDIWWVRHALYWQGSRPDAFAILRPTSPFRTAATIRRAYKQFCEMNDCGDSLRAIEPAKQSPYKMWTCEGPGYPIRSLLEGKHPDGTPYHSSPTQALPAIFVQNSSLEMAWTRCVEVYGTISGRKIAPFFTEELEGFSIDTEADWREAEYLVRTYPDALPAVDVARISPAPAAQ